MKTNRPTSAPVVTTPPKTAETTKSGVAALINAGAALATGTPASGFQDPVVAAKADLDGAPVSTTNVQNPFTPEERKELSKKIPCPALAGLFNAGMLKVAKDGTVKVPDLERALSLLGPDAAVRKVLTKAADDTDDIAGQFNLFKLNGSSLDHTGNSGIRQNGVHPERFDVLMSHSKDGETLTANDLADAAEAFAKEDPGLKGRLTQVVEMSAVMNVFGRTAEDGSRYFTREDAKQLFVDGMIPSSWSPPAVPNKIGLLDVLGSTALGLFRQMINGQ